jgi:hypothetical protein
MGTTACGAAHYPNPFPPSTSIPHAYLYLYIYIFIFMFTITISSSSNFYTHTKKLYLFINKGMQSTLIDHSSQLPTTTTLKHH